MDIVQNDYGYDMTFTIKDADGDTIDITGTTLTLSLKDVSSEDKIEKALTITDATNGICKYTVEEDVFKYVGTYSYQIQVDEASSVITIIGTENINVNEKIWDCSSL